MAKTKATSTPNYGFAQIDCAQDPNMLFQDYVKKDSKENWKKADSVIKAIDDRLTQLENEPSSNVVLGEEQQDKFNFVENEVIQDGLVVNAYRPDAKSIDTGITDTRWTVIFEGASDDFVTMSGDNLWYVICQKRNICITSNKISIPNGEESYININNNEVGVEVGKKITVVVTRDRNSGNITINNKNTIFEYTNNDNKKLFVGHHSRGDYNNDGKAKGWFRTLVYNRPLSPQEIEHNLSVLNNTDSIKSLEVTKDDTTTSYNFATDENHVEMSTGRTLHDEYMGVLKTMGKEFESPDGSDITVENGLEARVISGEISGRTVKRVDLGEAWSGTNFVAVNAMGINYETNYKIYNFTGLPVSVLLVNPSKNQKINNGDSIELSGSTINQIRGMTEDGWGVTVTDRNKLKNGLCLVSGDISDKIDVGLSSTQTIITNNGQEYKFYEPTIQGKTKILNGDFVSVEPTDETLPKLDGILNYVDEVDISTNILTKRIGEMTFNGSEEWKVPSTVSKEGFKFATLDLKSQVGLNDNEAILTLNNMFEDIKGVIGHTRQVGGLCLTDGQHLRVIIKSDDSRIENTESFKQFLSQNNLKVKYVLNENKITPLTKKQVDSYSLHKKVILLQDKEDTIMLNSDGSVVYTKNYNKEVININDYNINAYNHVSINESMIGFNIDTRFVDAYYTERKEKNLGYCDMFGLHSLEYVLSMTSGMGICLYSNGNIYGVLSKSALQTPDIDGVKKFLADKTITLIYKLKEPVTTHIPKELVNPILTQNNNNISVGGTVKPSSYKLTLPVNKLSDFEKRLQALESTTVNVVLNK